jgi:hypothetical protein
MFRRLYSWLESLPWYGQVGLGLALILGIVWAFNLKGAVLVAFQLTAIFGVLAVSVGLMSEGTYNGVLEVIDRVKEKQAAQAA